MAIALLVFLSMIVASCLVSMMGVFMGFDGVGLALLLALQWLSLPLTVAVFLLVSYQLVRRWGWRAAPGRSWRMTPGWLVFAFASVNSLVVAGELSYLFIVLLSAHDTPWQHHVPLLSALSSSLAFVAVYLFCVDAEPAPA